MEDLSEPKREVRAENKEYGGRMCLALSGDCKLRYSKTDILSKKSGM